MQREKLVVIFTVFVDIIGFGIVIPILPFYVGSFGASPFTITLLFSAFAFFAFLSSPFLGVLSDKVGRRPVLIGSIFSTAVGWVVFASATSIPMLFLGRIIDGAAAGNFVVAQSCIVDIAKDEKERSANIGLIGATFGVGFMVGPMLGGLLSTVSHAFPFWVAGGLALTNTVLAYFFLPETHRGRDPHAVISFNPLSPLVRAARNVNLRPLFLTWILFALAFMASQSIFALYAQHAFGFDSFMTGVFFSLIGVVTALNQTVLLNRVWLKYFTDAQLELFMIIVLLVSFIALGTRSLVLFYGGFPLLATGQAVLRVVVTSQVAGKANPHMKGEALGILTSLMAAAMVLAPVLSGALFEVFDALPFMMSALLMVAALWIALNFRRRGSFTQKSSAPFSEGNSFEERV